MTKDTKCIAAVALIALMAATAGFAAEPAQVAAPTSFPARLLSEMAPPPEQPGEDTWTFVADLQSPLWSSHGWSPRAAAAGEADLQRGIRIDAQFPDPDGVLKTAYADVADFLKAGNVPQEGPFVLETAQAKTSTFEAYRIEVTADRCRILAADSEGIRRGLFHIEDLMLRAGGPFLPVGTRERSPFIKSRISRCFFGPINRPPKNREELMDDVDYYPDQYLNRMAHEGINGLWLSGRFRDMCKTSVVPEFGTNAEKRLAKLRTTVEKCRRYGIRIYLYTNEPEDWSPGHAEFAQHPELLSDCPNGPRYFCPSSPKAAQFLYEATNSIFSAVPHLGGIINITHGEASTTCLSVVSPVSNAKPLCRVCAKRKQAEVIHDILAPMAKGMHDANPDADLIAWFYMPDTGELGEWVYEIPKYLPKNVTPQFNFESNVVRGDFDKGHWGSDYWLAVPGPSQRFEQVAYQAQKAGVPMGAKIQTGCSHEVATIPFVPAPGLLYRKFRAMHSLGVQHVMLCWYFGNYPGVMNKAAGELSFEPFPETEEAFLHDLASTDWGKHGDEVAQAWRLCAEGYGHFPLTTHFQYWGPMHDGVVWPLLLRPQDAPLAPTWLLSFVTSPTTREAYAPSGDRIGEAVGRSYSLSEAIELCRQMSDRWNQGVAILRRVETDPALSQQRQLDIGVARALGIQFRSGLNILRFYDLRERMAHQKKADQLATLQEMGRLVEAEIAGGEELIPLCERDSRLGFHSEAEGYKYFPEKIRWRIKQLRELLDTEMPALKQELERGTDVFAEYAGRAPKGPTNHSRFSADIGVKLQGPLTDLPEGLQWQTCSPPAGAKADGVEVRWASCYDREALYVLVDSAAADAKAASVSHVTLAVEPRRLWPCLTYQIPGGGSDHETRAEATGAGWRGWIRIPFAAMNVDAANPGPLRVNVSVALSQGYRDWVPKHAGAYRLLLGNINPADLGWLLLEEKPGK
jgi:hypothetical protein